MRELGITLKLLNGYKRLESHCTRNMSVELSLFLLFKQLECHGDRGPSIQGSPVYSSFGGMTWTCFKFWRKEGEVIYVMMMNKDYQRYSLI